MTAEVVTIHPDNPQPRLIEQVVRRLREGAVIAYPTDSSYALGCALGEKAAIDRIRWIRGFGKEHLFTLLCRDLSEISTYAKVENSSFRLLKSLTPGPYTFVLPATREVPRWVWHPKRKTIGIRVPEHPTAAAIAEGLGAAVMSVTLLLPDDDIPLSEAEQVMRRIGNDVDVIVDSGACNVEPTTVLDVTQDAPRLLRQGRGPVDHLGL
ncbi:MAG: threonylcarbamoyl-AMP synthase [Salinisphaeraceae bacterium]|jgi:tRNA threonylcarbamoyl adenosine modification protein (Sua5/YciO/YrdC/YwlC family)|nr:threonylcarbamoyl-AMP synthase [Salinisphaeraceae bacterium]